MSHLLCLHASLLQRRTEIRNDSTILLWMRKCWSAQCGSRRFKMSRSDYDAYYGGLLRQMTIEWSDGLADAVFRRMWERDARSFEHLDYSRFCCSIFFFVEMWVNDITIEEYSRIFEHIHLILKGDNQLTTRTRSTTLEAFFDALISQLDLEKDNASIGRSIIFDADRFNFCTGGWLPSMPLDRKPSKTQRSETFAEKRRNISGSANRQRRRSLPSLGSFGTINQLQQRPSSSRAFVQSVGTGVMNIKLVPKRLELLPCRNQGCFRLDP